ncbi:MAG: translation initiation factor IF-2, partial [Actinobacteria bacterium]|nr:translation initiation factor IF-2 [Actinomycetota bacterium]
RPGGPGQRPPRRKGRRRRNREELQPMDVPSYTPVDAPVPEGEVVVERASTALDLGPKLNRTAADVVRFLMQAGEMVTATQSLSDDMIELFAAEIGAEIRLVDPGEEQEVELQKLLVIDDESGDDAPLRPPVITVMGHVDHGKTLLLDRIRNANVADGEAGGITQHIGAYQVERDGQKITFIDTPGHAAFTQMRARGAESTDIVILMVAADDGVMPQTIEAINHAKAAEVPIIVAVNKIDRENADVDKAIAGVAEHNLVPEEWGGDTIFQRVSALQNIGIDELLDQILLVAEVEDLRATPEGRAQGVVLEANLDIGRGPVATVLVQSGTLRVGDPMVAGAAWGRVRALINDHGEQVKEAGPSTPVQVLGLSEVADAGREFVVAPNEKVAGRVADTREHWQRQSSLGREAHALAGGAKLEDIFDQIQRGEAATLNLIIKADVNGSLEALTESLRKLERDEVKIGFVHRGVGGITENDIQLAATANATIIGYGVRPDRKARDLADAEKVEIRTYEIIYHLLEDIESAMVGLLAPEFEEVVTGDAEVREIFSVPRIGKIAGCYVLNGVITRNSKVRFIREGTIIWKGTVQSLKRFKDDAREVAAGYECGIGLSDFQDLRPGDIIETYEEREIERTLEDLDS